MEKRIDIMEEKLDKIIFLLEEQKRIQIKLENHIDFIEKTYESLYTPLTFIKNSVSRMVGTSKEKELEHIPK